MLTYAIEPKHVELSYQKKYSRKTLNQMMSTAWDRRVLKAPHINSFIQVCIKNWLQRGL